jgi:hypothetical protein
MRLTAEYNLVDYKRNEDILEELKVDPVEKTEHSINKNRKIISAGLKILDTQNNSLTIDKSEEDLDDH